MWQPPLLLPGQWYLAWCPCGWYSDWPQNGPTRDLKSAEHDAINHEYVYHMPKTWRRGPKEDPNDPHRRMRLGGSTILMMRYMPRPPPMPNMQKSLDIANRWGRLTGAE